MFTPIRGIQKPSPKSVKKFPPPTRDPATKKIIWDENTRAPIKAVLRENLSIKPQEVLARLGWKKDDVTSTFWSKVAEEKKKIEQEIRNNGGPSAPPLPATAKDAQQKAAANLANYFSATSATAASAAASAQKGETEDPLNPPALPESLEELAEAFQQEPLMIAQSSICRSGDEYIPLPVVVHQTENFVFIILDCDANCRWNIDGNQHEFIEVTCHRTFPKGAADLIANLDQSKADKFSSDVITGLLADWNFQGSITIFPDNEEQRFKIDNGIPGNWTRKVFDLENDHQLFRCKVIVVPKEFKPREGHIDRPDWRGAEDV